MTDLKPCPFCGNPLFIKARKHNPFARCMTVGCKGTQIPLLNLDIPEDIAAWNTRAPEQDTVKVPAETLRKIHRDLDACQRVIHFAGGFDPAYVRDAQARLKEIDALLEASRG